MKNHLKHLVFLSFIFSIPSFSLASPTLIYGKVVNGNGMAIRAIAYSDYLSFKEDILSINEINSKDDFQLNFELDEIKQLYIRIGNQNFSFFAQPGKTYQFTVENLSSPPTSALMQQKPLHVKWEKTDALNQAIDNFNYTYGTFLENNFREIYKFHDVDLLNSFEKDIQQKQANTTNLDSEEKLFFDGYIKYILADLKLGSRTISNNKLGEFYLQKSEILYNNPSYMMFLKNYFKKYIVSNTRNINYHEFKSEIQNGSKRLDLLEYIKQDPILEQERLRELVLLKALTEIYNNPDFNSTQIKNLIQEIATTSSFKENQEIGNIIFHNISSFQIGSPAPRFNLKSLQGEYRNLENYKGRYVYLSFVSDNCNTCNTDRETLNEIHTKFNEDIAVVEIMVNYTQKGLEDYKQDTLNQQNKLVFENDFNLLNIYRVRNFPTYFLIDRKGNILQYPAKGPHEDMERYFDFLIKRDREKNEKQDILFR